MQKILLAAIILLVSPTVFSQDALRKTHFNTNKKGVAIQGYDPVAYFKQGKAIEGSSSNAVAKIPFNRFIFTSSPMRCRIFSREVRWPTMIKWI